MEKTLRLQCRVTPANPELIEHLMTVDPDYRGKRLVTMAALYMSMIASHEEPRVQRLAPAEVDKPLNADSKVKPVQKPSKAAPRWIKDANV